MADLVKCRDSLFVPLMAACLGYPMAGQGNGADSQ